MVLHTFIMNIHKCFYYKKYAA